LIFQSGIDEVRHVAVELCRWTQCGPIDAREICERFVYGRAMLSNRTQRSIVEFLPQIRIRTGVVVEVRRFLRAAMQIVICQSLQQAGELRIGRALCSNGGESSRSGGNCHCGRN
jgi:hypothetical protein